MNEYNTSIAQMLRTLADYLEMADGNVKVRIGAQFKLKNRPVVRIPVMPVDKFSATLGAWSSEEIMNTVRAYQKATGRTDGSDVLAQFEEAHKFLTGLTR